MADPDSTRLRELLLQVLSRPADARNAFLDEVCPQDNALRSEVQSLLVGLEKAGVSLDVPERYPAAALTDVPPGPPTAPAEAPGTRIGRYELLQLIGEGGFGSVFMAEQHHPVHRRVALKIIKLGMDTKQVIARFEAERQALAMMDHPSIAKVLDGGATKGGRPYFVMELVKGVSITEYCDGSKLSPRERLELFMSVCMGVQHAHQKGIIHRDLKPGNVLVTVADGKPVPKIIDFGIAKATSARLTEKTYFTEFRHLIGTPAYISPEQAEMNEIDIDTRSDIYSLGVLLYELLTGTTPFDARELRNLPYEQIQKMIREVEPPAPSARLSRLGDTLIAVAAQRRIEPKRLVHDMRGELDWIVMKCLEKDRSRRYETASDLAGDIGRYLRNEPVLARPSSTGYHIRKFVRRHRRGVVAAACVACALLFLMILLALATGWALRAERLQRQLRNEAEDHAAIARDRAKVAKSNEAIALTFLGDSRAKSADYAGARQSYAEAWDILKELGVPELPAIAGLLDAADEGPLMGFYGKTGGAGGLAEHVNGITCVVLSRNGRTAISGSNDHWIKVWDVPTGTLLRRLPEHSAEVAMVALAADDRTLASASQSGEIWLWDLETWTRKVLASAGVPAWALAFSRDGRVLLTGHEDGAIRRWDVRTGSELPPFEREKGHHGAVAALDISPDGRQVLSGSHDSTLRLWDFETGQVIRTFRGHLDRVNCALFLPDGRRALSGSFDRTLILWDLAREEPIGKPRGGHGSVVWRIAVSADGKTAFSASGDGTVRAWDLNGGFEIRKLAGQEGMAMGIACSREDAVVVAAGSVSQGSTVLRAWDGRDLREPQPGMFRVSAQPQAVAISNERLVLLGEGGKLILRDLATGKHLKDIEIPGAARLLALSGPNAAVVTEDDVIHLVDVQSATRREPKSPGRICAVGFVGGDPLAVSRRDGALALLDLRSGAELRRFQDVGTVRKAAISGDGKVVAAVADDQTIKVWDAVSGRLRAAFGQEKPSECMGLTLSTSGDVLWILRADGVLTSLDSLTGRPIRSMPAVRSGLAMTQGCMAASPDASAIICAGPDALRLWDFRRPSAYRFYENALAVQRAEYEKNPRNLEGPRPPLAPSFLAMLGQWHAFRGKDDWAVACLKEARDRGEKISALTLARSYWRLADSDRQYARLAVEEFDRALAETGQSAAAIACIKLCREAAAKQAGD